jgi:hypothetical protein
MQTHDEADVARAARLPSQPKNDHDLDVARAVADPASATAASLIELQRLAGNASVSRMLTPSDEEQESQRSPVLDVVDSGGGSPLEADLRQEMEGRLGADFGDVRIHSDAKASESARSVQANAYTVGNDVVFRSDQWSPGSEGGKQTLAHELTHVVQQRSGPVAGTDTGSGIKVSSPGDEFEQAADRSAKEALTGPAPQTAAPAGPTAQRQGEDELEEEELQGSFVQRQGEGELEEEEELQGSFVQRQTEEEMLGEEEEETV